MAKCNNAGLNKKQIDMANMLASPDFDGTVTELCQTIGVSRKTFYVWMDNPVFTNYISELIDKFADSEVGTVWKALIRQCACGNIQAIKLYFDVKDRYQRPDYNSDISKLHDAFEVDDNDI